MVAWELIFAPDEVWARVSGGPRPNPASRPKTSSWLACTITERHPSEVPVPPLRRSTPGRWRMPPWKPSSVPRNISNRHDSAPAPVRLTSTPNRRELTPDQGWWLGYNENGVSDKTVGVLRFEDLSGRPIAFFINYSVHAVIMGPENYQITGDLAGATSRFVERHYLGEDHPRSDAGHRLRLRPEEKAVDGGVVAIWTSGAAGDQNPVSMASGEHFTLVDALGKILGEEVVRVSSAIKTSPNVRLWGAQQVVTCPGRRVEAGPRPRTEYQFTDADPVNIRLGLVIIDRSREPASGEVFTQIAQHLRKDSPFHQTIMVTHANGSSGYIPSDGAFDEWAMKSRPRDSNRVALKMP